MLITDVNLLMNCTFKKINPKTGNYEQCEELVLKEKMDKNNYNNNYCIPHQELINKINNQRKEQYIKEYKEQILNEIKEDYFYYSFQDREDFDIFKRNLERLLQTIKLKNGDFK